MPPRPARASRVRAALHRRGVQAGLIFALLLGAYISNGDILPGNDAAASVRLAGKLVTKHKLVFTPEEEPFMFEWPLKNQPGKKAHFRSWHSNLNGEPVRRAWERGELGTPVPVYNLMPTHHPGAYANRYGVGAALWGVPFVAAVYPFAADLYERPSGGLLWYATKFAASCAVAASAVLLFLTALRFVRPMTAVCLAVSYGLGTSVWSTSSQALWQHAPAGLFLALGTAFLLQRERPWAAYLVGLSYGLAFVCRPTAAVVLAAVGIHYLMRDRRALLRFVLGGLPAALLLAAYNWRVFGTALVLGQMNIGAAVSSLFDAVPVAQAATGTPNGAYFQAPLFEGLAGILLSPSRGLFVFSPIAVVAVWGLVRVFRDDRFTALRPVAVAVVAMCLITARWFSWWGGWSYGPRLLLEVVVLLAFLAIPVAEQVRDSRPLRAVFVVCFVWSVAVQGVGALAYDVVGWNQRTVFVHQPRQAETRVLFTDEEEARAALRSQGGTVVARPVNVDAPEGHSRLWSVRDSQLVYYFTRFFEARRLKQQAIREFLSDSG